MLIHSTPEAREMKNAFDSFVLYEFLVKTVQGEREYENSITAMIYLERVDAGITMRFVPIDFFDHYKTKLFTKHELQTNFVAFLDSKCYITPPLYDSITDIVTDKIESVKKYFKDKNINVDNICFAPVDYDLDPYGLETLEDMMYALQSEAHISTTSVMSLHSPCEYATTEVLSVILSFFGADESNADGGLRGLGSLARIFASVENSDSSTIFCPSSTQIRNFRQSKIPAIKNIHDNMINGDIDYCIVTFSPFYLLLRSDNNEGVEIASFIGASNDTLYFNSSSLESYVSIETGQIADFGVEPNCMTAAESLAVLEEFPFNTEVKISVNTRGGTFGIQDPRILCFGMMSDKFVEIQQPKFMLDGDACVVSEVIVH